MLDAWSQYCARAPQEALERRDRRALRGRSKVPPREASSTIRGGETSDKQEGKLTTVYQEHFYSRVAAIVERFP